MAGQPTAILRSIMVSSKFNRAYCLDQFTSEEGEKMGRNEAAVYNSTQSPIVNKSGETRSNLYSLG